VPDKWTPDTLYEHFTKLREADQDALKAALSASDYRLAGMNEFRASVQDIIGKALTRSEAWTFLVGVVGAIGVIAAVYSVVK
jgi:hypothetical protein